MFLSPLQRFARLRFGVSVACLALLAGCEVEPVLPRGEATPTPTPMASSIPTAPIAKANPGLSDKEIAEFRSSPAQPDDFIINFGEPFIGFETRGDKVLVSDHTSGQRIAEIVTVRRDRDGLTHRIEIDGRDALGERYRWTLSIEPEPCADEYSGELTDWTTWSDSAGRNYRLRGCARIVGTPQEWPDGFEP